MDGRSNALRMADLAMGLPRAPRRRVDAPTPVAPQPCADEPPSRPAQPQAQVKPAATRPPSAIAAVTSPDARHEALERLRERHDRECAHCTTAKGHTRTVFGEGDPCARLLFVGEAPGETEDRVGRPFVGRAGEKLDEMIAAMGLHRERTYIANVLKSRPPDNRTPLQHEVEACGPWLFEQIRIVRPEVIVTLGGPATKLLLGVEEGITRLRGTWQRWTDPAGGLEIPLMPTYHPAYLLRNYTPKTRGEVWSDLQAVMAALGLGRG